MLDDRTTTTADPAPAATADQTEDARAAGTAPQPGPAQVGATPNRGHGTFSARRRAGLAAGSVGVALLVAAVLTGRPPDPSGPALTPEAPQPPAAVAVRPDLEPRPAPAPAPPPAPAAAAFDLATLPFPSPIDLLPAGLPQATVTDVGELPHLSATPVAVAIPVWTVPDDTFPPVLALRDHNYADPARWVVTQSQGDWVQVLLPEGRLALPSQDPSAVNHAAGWVRSADVTLTPEASSAVVDLSDRSVTVTAPSGSVETIPTGVGAPATPTPPGLGQVLTIAESQVGLAVYTSLQSETIDSFLGSGGAMVAFHVGPGQGREVSNGCLRLTAAGLEAMRALPVGAPILVRP